MRWGKPLLIGVMLVVTGISIVAIHHTFKQRDALSTLRLVLIGEQRYTQVKDIQRCIIETGQVGNILTQDMHAILQKIKQLPWIKEVKIRKEWPNRLSIQFEEYVPLVRWNDNYFLDAAGNQFTLPEHVEEARMPLFYGPVGMQKRIMADYHVLREFFEENNLSLKAIEVNNGYAWRLILADGMYLELGREKHLERLQRFIKVCPLLCVKEGRRIKYADLRYKSGVAISG